MKYLLTLTVLLFISAPLFSQQTADMLIKNGKIIDGTGNSWYYGDVAVKNGKILRIGKNIPVSALKIIDAAGLVIAPGFIDVHGHIEDGIILRPTADNYVHDGVTTVVTGNCGGSVSDIPHFFHQVDSIGTSINVATLIGHNTVREQVMDRDNRAPTAESSVKWKHWLKKQ